MTGVDDPKTTSTSEKGEGVVDQHEHHDAQPKEEAYGDEESAKDGTTSKARDNPFDAVQSFVKSAMTGGPEDEQEYESPLPEDIFSLMYLCEDWSWAFFFSVFIFLVQLSIIVLILFDLIDLTSSENPLKMPPGVDLTVSIAQAVSMVLAAATQTNLLTSLSRMAMGPSYDHEYVTSVYPHATRTTYRVSFMCQFIAGVTMLTVNFILNMQSVTVLSLMLNFAALAFVSEIQDTAFWVAKHGYISIRLQEATMEVANFHIPKQHRQHSNTLIKRICFVLILTSLLVFYSILVRQQRSGLFICNKLLVQFGDEFRPDMAFFSDVYIRTNKLISDRATYEDEKQSGARFAYCDKDQVWTFSGPYDIHTASIIEGNLSVPDSYLDPCNYWIRSRQTNTYDITETISHGWYVHDYFSNQTLPTDHLFLECNDCEGGRATHSCSGHGTCNDNTCVCDEGRIGTNCEYPTPCSRLELDQRTQPFPYASGGSFVPRTSYEILLDNESKPVLVYNKPVYFAYLSPTKIPLNMLIFTGRRYALLLNIELLDADGIQRLRQGLPGYLPDFHTWFSKHRTYFFSDPMDYGTPSDWSSPVDAQWYRARELFRFEDRSLYRVDHNQPTNTVLLCPICQLAFNNCLNDGNCTGVDDRLNGDLSDFMDRQGVCECAYGFTGHLCEKELNCFARNATCLNGGNCTVDGSCSCPTRYAGKLCQYELEEWYIEELMEV